VIENPSVAKNLGEFAPLRWARAMWRAGIDHKTYVLVDGVCFAQAVGAADECAV
jgi:hypothetical protein